MIDGYAQCICQRGHYFIGGTDPMMINWCHYCRTDAAWENIVDCGHFENDGLIPIEALAPWYQSMEVAETCNLGVRHILQPAVYRIPTARETDPLRTYPKK